jgi:hypothetical protein
MFFGRDALSIVGKATQFPKIIEAASWDCDCLVYDLHRKLAQSKFRDLADSILMFKKPSKAKAIRRKIETDDVDESEQGN